MSRLARSDEIKFPAPHLYNPGMSKQRLSDEINRVDISSFFDL